MLRNTSKVAFFRPFVAKGKIWPKKPKNYVKNNHDYGPAFWPQQITHDGFPFMALKVANLQSEVNLWQGKQAMVDMLKTMKKDDYLIMIAQ